MKIAAMSYAAIPEERFTLEETLFDEEGRSLHLVRERAARGRLLLLEAEGFPSEDNARAAAQSARSWQNLVSLNSHPAFLVPLEVSCEGSRVHVLYEGIEGAFLPRYVRDFFKGYPADESFALELAWQLVEIVRDVLSQGGGSLVVDGVRLERTFLSGEGRVRILPPFLERGEDISARRLIRSFADLLFAMLTLESPRARVGALAKCRDVNGEITEATEALIRRCAAGDEEGGFANLLSLRQALHEALKSRGVASTLREGYIAGFRGKKPEIPYRERIEEAVEKEKSFQERLRSFDLRKELGPMANLLRDAWRQLDWKKMWPFYIVPYLLFMVPLLLGLRIQSYADFGWAVGLIGLSVPFYIALVMAFAHVRRPIE